MGKPTKGRARTQAVLSKGRGRRQPKTLALAPDHSQNRPRFSFEYADRHYCGAWRWPEQDEALELLNFFCEMSQLSWAEIWQQQAGGYRKHHSQPLDSVCSEAQRRFNERRLDGTFEEYFRFRLSGEKRLWGFIRDGVFYVLWWDPHHKVYPSEKKHT